MNWAPASTQQGVDQGELTGERESRFGLVEHREARLVEPAASDLKERFAVRHLVVRGVVWVAGRVGVSVARDVVEAL